MKSYHEISFYRWRRLRWEKDSRYYEAILQQDLWGDWVVTRAWGRRGTALGQVRNHAFNSYEDALQNLESVAVRRGKRGYNCVNVPPIQ